MSDCVIALSGGQDSTTCLYWAREKFDNVHAFSIRYGQKHAVELERAAQIAKMAEVEHVVFDLPVLSQLGGSALVSDAVELSAAGGFEDSEAPGGLPTSFVPGRNLLFLSIAASVAVSKGCSDIVTGVCQTDYSGYPDCRREFVDALERAATLAMPSSAGPIVIHTPLMTLTKADSVRLARSLDGCWDALALTVTCYNGVVGGCGDCPACELRSAGFAEAGEEDPAIHGA